MTFRILIADDHKMVRDTRVAYLAALGDFTTTAVADVDENEVAACW